MKENVYDKLEERLGYTFKDKELLKHALIHRSYGNEHWEYKKINNERLELLGDAVLDLVVTEYLYKNFTKSSEGDLAKLKSMVVSEPVLAKISRELGIGKYLLLSKGEELTGGRDRSSILGDVFEAVLGAIYLDSGSDFLVAKAYGTKLLEYQINHIEENEELIDFKTILQEHSQKSHKVTPVYEVVKETGPDHRKNFEIVVSINDEAVGRGNGRNKKSAEQSAAKDACKKLGVKAFEAL
ncbi:ribonuclease 3 [Propionigenium maris DSM 9537]|uniref:Ribonuclease 3 n=1 Tax=Propionigenium maris DSM 9537 TaxID=1123000 RepID=A0A9W6LMN8_9FUSO|nr:ribonuclease III [Propionigenium maris]GLI56014.1 ribonuclease 3 [Propionigenium maris DSM 9537]